MDTQFFVGVWIISLTTGALILVLLRPLARSQRGPLNIVPDDLGGYTTAGLVLSSMLGLYLELLLIRWISSEVRVFAYFKNFVLIACFLGFGLGCYLARRTISVLALCVPVMFFSAAIAVPWPPLRQVTEALPQLLGASSEIFIWGTDDSTGGAWSGLLVASLIVLPMFVLIAIVFIPVGQLVGWYLEAAPHGIRAYSVNVLASLSGIALYTGLCFADQPPVAWLVVAGVLATALFWRARAARWVVLAGFAICVALAAAQQARTSMVYWSPYQKLTITPLEMGGRHVGYELETNGSWHQSAMNLPLFLQMIGARANELNGYDLPYRFTKSPQDVLVLGAGMGNDVAAALRNGSKQVTAVEIDPLIFSLGRQLHPEKPYDSPRVRVVIDDARSYIENSDERFDLIVFSLLDSHTTSSHFTNIRLDNYVYTVEAMEAAKKLLKPTGVFIVKFHLLRRPWIADRLYGLVTRTFGFEPVQLDVEARDTTWGRFFVTGSRERIHDGLLDPTVARYVAPRAGAAPKSVTLTTDDWPYFYQSDRGLPMSVVTISALLIAISLLGAKHIGLGPRSVRVEFFLLGAGFMLLEAQIISRMALLFGTTWVVNSIVIAVLLLLIVAANNAVTVFPRINPQAGYGAIILTIAFNYFLPVRMLFFKSFALRATVATLVLCLPVFFAGIVFVQRFAAARFAPEAIGSNLLGALAGGIAESLSLWFGLRALLGIAALLYLGAWLYHRTSRAPHGTVAEAGT